MKGLPVSPVRLSDALPSLSLLDNDQYSERGPAPLFLATALCVPRRPLAPIERRCCCCCFCSTPRLHGNRSSSEQEPDVGEHANPATLEQWLMPDGSVSAPAGFYATQAWWYSSSDPGVLTPPRWMDGRRSGTNLDPKKRKSCGGG